MRNFILSLLFLLPSIAVANGTSVSNKLLTVDQLGNFNESNVLATVAQQTTNATKVVVAEAKANAAAQAALQTSNDVNAVATAIVNKNLVVYSYGNVDSFNSGGFVWNAETDYLRVFSTEENPLTFSHEYTTPYKITANIPFLVSQEIPVDSVQILATKALGNMNPEYTQEHFAEMMVEDVTVETGVTIPEGDTGYGFKATATHYDPDSKYYFYRVRLENDTPAADGAALDLVNGVSGGQTITIPGTNGWPTLTFEGGSLMDVKYED